MSGAETRHRNYANLKRLEEHCMWEEAVPEGAVDCMEENAGM